MKVLLTGGSSFTGLWFARALAARGIGVVAPLRGRLDGYADVRGARVRALAEVAEVVPDTAFGEPAFVDLLDRAGCDVLCHHAAHVADYRSPDFDVAGALEQNTRNVKAIAERLAAKAFAAVVLTSSVFEPDTGAGTEPREAFSPYGLSKALTAATIRYWCSVAGLPLGRFVIANPFGPFEEPRFCAYLVKTWASGGTPSVRTPSYVRDNIHVSLLAAAYADFVVTVAATRRPATLLPSGYVESQGAFALRFAREIGARVALPCPVTLDTQTDFSEPLVRINTDRLDIDALGWSEAAAWDALAEYYAGTFALRR